jgi:hypothetical protein
MNITVICRLSASTASDAGDEGKSPLCAARRSECVWASFSAASPSLAIAKRKAEFLQVALGKIVEHIPVDPLRGELFSVRAEANLR